MADVTVQRDGTTRRSWGCFGALILMISGSGCRVGGKPPPEPGDVVSPAARICVAVSVDWEGAYLDPDDLQAFTQFRRELPDVPLTHLVNAGYFTKRDIDPVSTAQAISAVIGERDELGLHIHGWASLARRAGIEPRLQPSFLDAEGLVIEGDRGFDVPLEAYSVDDIRALVRTSRKILAEHGFVVSATFRAAGWLAGERVLEAIRAEGFEIDSSAVDADWLEEMADVSLPDRIRECWPDVHPDTQPFWIETRVGRLLEMPDTGALADYATADEMVAHLESVIASADAAPGTLRFAHVGFHQEGAADFAPRVIDALTRMKTRDKRAIVYDTVKNCAARFTAARQ